MAKRKLDGPIVSLLRPRKPEVVSKIADEYLAGKNPNLNQGIIPKDQWEKIQAECKEQGKPEPYHIYQPVIVELAHAQGSKFAMLGHKSKTRRQPAAWNTNTCGAFESWMKIDDFTVVDISMGKVVLNDGQKDIIMEMREK